MANIVANSNVQEHCCDHIVNFDHLVALETTSRMVIGLRVANI